jgi:DNA-directed RNA polymerase specialized sigma24 family protein
MCLDFQRARYGRNRDAGNGCDGESVRAFRRSLADSISAEFNVDALPDSSSMPADAHAVRLEIHAALCRELTRRGPRDRLLLALRFQDGLSAARIAAVLDLANPFVVYRQLNSILSRLRELLEARGIDGVDG